MSRRTMSCRNPSGALRPAALLGVLLATLAIAGCGDPALWARWRAERELYLAHLHAQRVIARGVAASPAAWDAAALGYERVVEHFPIATWLARGEAGGPAREVALAGVQALLERARLEVARGDDPAAIAAFREVTAHALALPGPAIQAYPALAAAAERQGAFDDRLAAWTALAQIDPLADPGPPVPAPDLLEAPLIVAREWRARGRAAAADSALAAGDRRFALALSRARGAAVSPIADALARIRVARGDGAGALLALRTSFVEAQPYEHPARLLAMARSALAAGLSDSAGTFARAAAALDGGRRTAAPALLVQAQAWAQRGVVDSALASYETLLSRWPDPGAVGPQARYEHALTLETAGRWAAARAELRSVAARYPTHPLAFAALRHVVQHDLQHGEVELARVLGDAELETLARLIATDHDPEVQRQAWALRGDLQLALGAGAAAESTYIELWRRFPGDSLAEAAGLHGAQLAEERPGGGAERAARLYGQLSARAHSAAIRQAAAAAAARAPHAVPVAEEHAR